MLLHPPELVTNVPPEITPSARHARAGSPPKNPMPSRTATTAYPSLNKKADSQFVSPLPERTPDAGDSRRLVIHPSPPLRSAMLNTPAKMDKKSVRTAGITRRPATNRAAAPIKPDTIPPMADMNASDAPPMEALAMPLEMLAEMMKQPAGMETAEAKQPLPPVNDRVIIRLAAETRAASTLSAGSASSLADLRRALRRDNAAALSNENLFTPGSRRELMLAVYKTRF
jgi:hypothetical protein